MIAGRVISDLDGLVNSLRNNSSQRSEPSISSALGEDEAPVSQALLDLREAVGAPVADDKAIVDAASNSFVERLLR